jgi:hypothetical protein
MSSKFHLSEELCSSQAMERTIHSYTRWSKPQKERNKNKNYSCSILNKNLTTKSFKNGIESYL